MFEGASCEVVEDKKIYTKIAPIFVNRDAVVAFYDHTILTQSNKLRVMEDVSEIWRRLSAPPAARKRL